MSDSYAPRNGVVPDDEQRRANAEALCNLWGQDPNDEASWQEAWDFAPEWQKSWGHDERRDIDA